MQKGQVPLFAPPLFFLAYHLPMLCRYRIVANSSIIQINVNKMKKLFTTMMAVAAISFASCGGNTKTETVDTDSTAVEAVAEEEVVAAVDEIATALESGDEAVVKTNVETLTQKIQALIEKGDVEAAKAYALKLQEWYQNNKEKVDALAQNGTTIEQLINAAVALPTTVTGAAQEVVDAAKADAETVKEAAKAAAEQKAEEAKEAAKAKVEEEVNKATQKAADKANEAVNDAAKKAANKLLGK